MTIKRRSRPTPLPRPVNRALLHDHWHHDDVQLAEAVIRSVKLIVQPDADYLARQSGAAPLEFVANTAADHVNVRGAPRVPGRKTSGNWK